MHKKARHTTLPQPRRLGRKETAVELRGNRSEMIRLQLDCRWSQRLGSQKANEKLVRAPSDFSRFGNTGQGLSP